MKWTEKKREPRWLFIHAIADVSKTAIKKLFSPQSSWFLLGQWEDAGAEQFLWYYAAD